MGRIDLSLSFPVDKTDGEDRAIPDKLISAEDVIQVEHVEFISTPTTESGRQNAQDSAELHACEIQPQARRVQNLPFIEASEVAKRDGMNGNRLWIVVDDVVLDCTDFKHRHPAGKAIIEGFGGLDCSWQWWSFHSQQIMQTYGMRLRIGRTKEVPNKYERPARKQFALRVAGEQW